MPNVEVGKVEKRFYSFGCGQVLPLFDGLDFSWIKPTKLWNSTT
jgi:hypothetical protein